MFEIHYDVVLNLLVDGYVYNKLLGSVGSALNKDRFYEATKFFRLKTDIRSLYGFVIKMVCEMVENELFES